MQEQPNNRIVIVLKVFPSRLEPYIVDRFVRLHRLGWDVWIVCDQFDAREWATIPSLAADLELRKRVYLSGSGGPGLAAESLAPQLVHVAFGYLAPSLMNLRERLRCKLMVTFESYDPYLVSRPGYYKHVWDDADAVHTVSEHLWHFVQRAGCPADKLHAVIPPGVDADFFDPGLREHTEVAGATRELRILSIGRLHWAKGYDYGLQAIRKLKEQGISCAYRIVGDGELRSAVEYAIDDFGLWENVRLLGERSPRQIKTELLLTDVLLHSSVSESFGIATIEAQSMKIPVVCTDANGLPEAVANQETGLIVPRRDPAALANALSQLALDPLSRQRLGEAGRQRVQRLFKPEALTRQFGDLYHRVLALPVEAE